jgi:hypothetical protein
VTFIILVASTLFAAATAAIGYASHVTIDTRVPTPHEYAR